MRVEDEIDLGIILERGETSKKDGEVDGLVYGRDGEDERC